MSNNITSTLFGCDYPTIGSISVKSACDDKIALGISAGTIEKPNEDALGITQLDNKLLIAIADGHWGQEASALAIEKSLGMLDSSFRPPQGHEFRGRLYMVFNQINSILLESAMSRPGAPTSETSLIVCYFDTENERPFLYWASFGDSYLFVKHRKTKIDQLNTLCPHWLGALSKMSETANSEGISLEYPSGSIGQYVGVAKGLETGIIQLSDGDILLLCTDGLIDPLSAKDQPIESYLEQFLSNSKTLTNKAELLIESALEKGGRDNISCILVEV